MTQEQRIGIVAAGYADGYPHNAPTGDAHAGGRYPYQNSEHRFNGYAGGGFDAVIAGGDHGTGWIMRQKLGWNDVACCGGHAGLYELLCAVARRACRL